ncbi:hypothetical protein J3R74_002170 [Puniceicoccus vermicola]
MAKQMKLILISIICSVVHSLSTIACSFWNINIAIDNYYSGLEDHDKIEIFISTLVQFALSIPLLAPAILIMKDIGPLSGLVLVFLNSSIYGIIVFFALKAFRKFKNPTANQTGIQPEINRSP